MSLSQIKYLNTARDGEFSLRAWAILGDTRDPEQLELIWKHDALKLLKKQNERGSRIFNQMSKMLHSDRMAIFQKLKDDVSK